MAGGHILREALERGYAVRALAREPGKLAYLRDRIEIIPGDALSADSIHTLLTGSDVVISALGPVTADGTAGRELTTTASGHIVAAMEAQGIRQYILVSGAGVVMPGDQRNATGWWVRQLARLRYSSLLSDRQSEYELLEQSTVDWTIVRCPLIDSTTSRQPARVSLASPQSFTVRAGELAAFILDQVGSEEFARRGPFLGSE
jgi:putative NADH-flavin reductase